MLEKGKIPKRIYSSIEEHEQKTQYKMRVFLILLCLLPIYHTFYYPFQKSRPMLPKFKSKEFYPRGQIIKNKPHQDIWQKKIFEIKLELNRMEADFSYFKTESEKNNKQLETSRSKFNDSIRNLKEALEEHENILNNLLSSVENSEQHTKKCDMKTIDDMLKDLGSDNGAKMENLAEKVNMVARDLQNTLDEHKKMSKTLNQLANSNKCKENCGVQSQIAKIDTFADTFKEKTASNRTALEVLAKLIFLRVEAGADIVKNLWEITDGMIEKAETCIRNNGTAKKKSQVDEGVTVGSRESAKHKIDFTSYVDDY